jgi:hypothetical protein
MPVKLPAQDPQRLANSPGVRAIPEGAAAEDQAMDQKLASKFDPFHPEMPKIPGVSAGSLPAGRAPRGSGFNSNFDSQRLMLIGGGAAAVVLLGGLIFWWALSKSRGTSALPADATFVEQPAPSLPVPSLRTPIHDGPTEAATAQELSKPWSAKKFTFVKPITQENIDAIVIRLPSGGLWAFALQGPADRCALDFVTDVDVLATKYGFTAAHPMVVSPCDRTVYDPLKVGALGGNTWVRGEIVQGSALRPPISIDVKQRGRTIIADSIE